MTDIELKDVERLRLEPGDVLVYVTPDLIDAETATRLTDQLRHQFGAHVPVVVLDAGARFQVVNKAEIGENAP